MRNQVQNRVSLCAIAMIFLGLTAVGLPMAAVAQERPPEPAATTRVPSDLRLAHEFLFGVQPGLLEHRAEIRSTPAGRRWLIQVVEASASAVSDEPQQLLLSAVVELDARGQLLLFTADGPLVEQAKNDQLWQQMRTHPEWTDVEAEQWLTNAGGDVTADRAAPALARLGELSWHRFLGSNLRVERSSFRWRGEGPFSAAGRSSSIVFTEPVNPGPPERPSVSAPPPLLAVRPLWVAYTNGVGTDGQPGRYRLEFEPFGGQLIRAVRQ